MVGRREVSQGRLLPAVARCRHYVQHLISHCLKAFPQPNPFVAAAVLPVLCAQHEVPRVIPVQRAIKIDEPCNRPCKCSCDDEALLRCQGTSRAVPLNYQPSRK